MIAAFTQHHRMREAALLIEPEISLLGQFFNAPFGKEFRRNAFRRGFIGDVLGSLFTELKMRTFAVRLRPGAAGEINSLLLIDLQERLCAAHDAHLAESEACRG